ncbi:MAG: hypothetical protein WD042_14655 [Phycisphaeraceae bacterium]
MTCTNCGTRYQIKHEHFARLARDGGGEVDGVVEALPDDEVHRSMEQAGRPAGRSDDTALAVATPIEDDEVDPAESDIEVMPLSDDLDGALADDMPDLSSSDAGSAMPSRRAMPRSRPETPASTRLSPAALARRQAARRQFRAITWLGALLALIAGLIFLGLWYFQQL